MWNFTIFSLEFAQTTVPAGLYGRGNGWNFRHGANVLREIPGYLSAASRLLTTAGYIVGGEGGIRTHVPGSSPDKSISSRPRYDHFGTSPQKSQEMGT